MERLSIHELRRRAPLHYLAKADNARFTASLLWASLAADHEAHAEEVHFGGRPNIALFQAFLREGAISLELILKAVIAQRIECGVAKDNLERVPPVHHLSRLWSDAELPVLSREDARRLLIVTRVLYWSGRYPAPLKDDDFNKEEAAFEKLERAPQTERGTGWRIQRSRLIEWPDVDRLYGVAARTFWSIRGE